MRSSAAPENSVREEYSCQSEVRNVGASMVMTLLQTARPSSGCTSEKPDDIGATSALRARSDDSGGAPAHPRRPSPGVNGDPGEVALRRARRRERQRAAPASSSLEHESSSAALAPTDDGADEPDASVTHGLPSAPRPYDGCIFCTCTGRGRTSPCARWNPPSRADAPTPGRPYANPISPDALGEHARHHQSAPAIRAVGGTKGGWLDATKADEACTTITTNNVELSSQQPWTAYVEDLVGDEVDVARPARGASRSWARSFLAWRRR